MMKENSVTFLSQYVTACFFPSKYRELVEDKKHSIWAYIMVLVLVLTMIVDVIPFLAWETSVGGMENLLRERIPAFTIRDGLMECDQPMSFSIGNVCFVREDTGEEAFSASDVKEEGYAFYFSKTNMVMKTPGGSQEISYKDFGDTVVDNDTLVSILPIYKVSMALSMVFLYVVNVVQFMAVSFFLALLCMGMVRDPGGDRLSFGVTFQIVAYARTLFVLIQDVGTTLGFPVNGLFAQLILVMATFSHISRGQASVLKIDLKK